MISREEVLKIAELIKLKLADDAVERFQGELSSILDFIKKLGEATDKTPVEIRQVMGLENATRPDKEEGLVTEAGPGLIEQAPQHKDSAVVVPEIFKRNQ